MTPGTYTGEAVGHRGTLKVSVTVSESAIEKIDFVEDIPRTNAVMDAALSDPDYPTDPVDPKAEYAVACLKNTPQVLGTVTDRLGERIIASQSLNVDSVCGATMSSFGYKEAVRAALAQSGGDLTAFDGEVPKSADSKNYDGFDVVVVGGGGSGILAAAKATAEGAKVLLIEKSARLGGCASLSSGGHFLNSNLQKQAGFPPATGEDPFVTGGMTQALFNPKFFMWKQFSDKGGEAIDFLTEKGDFDWLVMEDSIGYAQNSNRYSMAYDGWQKVADNIDTVLTETQVMEFITDDSGTIAGVKGIAYDGTTITVVADKVVIATGGWIGNPEMMVEHNRWFFSLAFTLAQNKGEGTNLMFDAGAAKYHMGGISDHMFQPAGEITGVDDHTAMIPYSIFATPVFPRISQRGERFQNEGMIMVNGMNQMGNSFVSAGTNFYVVISQDQADILAAQGLQGVGLQRPPFNPNFNFFPLPVNYKMEKINDALEAGVEANFIFKGDTYEELAEAAGFIPETFLSHIKRYERACENGIDDLYDKDPSLLVPLGAGPYYAIKCEHCPYCSIGGVEIDEQFRVLDSNGYPIPNLYATGVEANGVIYGGAAYSDLGSVMFGWMVFSGYAAGASAVGKPLVG
jgi:fumarate reductase flavoprotein subunit